MVGMVAQSGPDERSGPLTSSERFAQVVLVCSLGAGYIVVSSGLISYNKFLIHRERFPFAVPLVFMHACFCSCLSFFLYLVKPSLFPSLTDEAQRVPLDRDLILKGALPIAIFFSGQLALSNSAYLHSSVAFLQMMKEANLALVYTLSLVAALERFHSRNAAILVAVVAATLMTIHGELHFSFTGFALQGSSQLFECTKIVMQAMLLSAPGRKLDALTYVLLVMPFCALLLGGSICGIHLLTPHSDLLLPSLADLAHWWPHLLANSCIAFTLNVVIALFVKHSSAVSFILAGMVKDAMIVISGVFILSEVISRVQAVGFTIQLMLILVYTLAKSFPKEFENGIFEGLALVFFGDGSGRAAAPAKGLADAAAAGDPSSLKVPAGKDYGALAEAGALPDGSARASSAASWRGGSGGEDKAAY